MFFCFNYNLYRLKTGGTIKVGENLIYLPIAILVSSNGKKHGFIFAVICALLIDPFMPLDVKNNIPQAPLNWIFIENERSLKMYLKNLKKLQFGDRKY